MNPNELQARDHLTKIALQMRVELGLTWPELAGAILDVGLDIARIENPDATAQWQQALGHPPADDESRANQGSPAPPEPIDQQLSK
jgi:hypothetical protein